MMRKLALGLSLALLLATSQVLGADASSRSEARAYWNAPGLSVGGCEGHAPTDGGANEVLGARSGDHCFALLASDSVVTVEVHDDLVPADGRMHRAVSTGVGDARLDASITPALWDGPPVLYAFVDTRGIIWEDRQGVFCGAIHDLPVPDDSALLVITFLDTVDGTSGTCGDGANTPATSGTLTARFR